MNKEEFLKHVQVVEDEEADKADFLVCNPADFPTPFTDNLTGFCCKCGVKVQFRWHAPRTPKRICFHCVIKQVEEEKNEKALSVRNPR